MAAQLKKTMGAISQNEYTDKATDPWDFADRPPNLGVATEQDTVPHNLDNVETKLKAHDYFPVPSPQG